MTAPLAQATHVIGVDLGGTKTAAGVVDSTGVVLMSETIPTLNRAGGEAILDATSALIAGLVERAADAGHTVSGVGVGSAGVIDAASGTVVSATDAILGWAGTALAAGLSARLGLDVRAVNDVHAHALGEAWLGAAAGSSSSLMVAFGTGVGGSFVLDGTPVLGHRFVGGHVGHFASPYATFDGVPLACVCGSAGHVEAIASGPAIHESYLRLGVLPWMPLTPVACSRWPNLTATPTQPPRALSPRPKPLNSALPPPGKPSVASSISWTLKPSWSPAALPTRATSGGRPWRSPCAGNCSRRCFPCR